MSIAGEPAHRPDRAGKRQGLTLCFTFGDLVPYVIAGIVTGLILGTFAVLVGLTLSEALIFLTILLVLGVGSSTSSSWRTPRNVRFAQAWKDCDVSIA